MGLKTVPVDNNNASLIWSVCGKTNCYRRIYKYPQLKVSTDPGCVTNVNRRSQVGFIQKKQLIIKNKKDKMLLVRKQLRANGKVVIRAQTVTGPRRANRLAYLTGRNFLFSKSLAKNARIKACVQFCRNNKVKKRGSKSAAASS